jgi:hypothetical protein
MRALSIATMLLLFATPTLSASPKVESALKVLQAVGADANKLKAFCELMGVDEKLGDKEDLALEAQMDKLLDQLGADFKVAWNTIEDIDEHSPDGRALSAAMDLLEAKCSSGPARG